MTKPIPGDVEAAVERAKQALVDYLTPGKTSYGGVLLSANALSTLLASHAMVHSRSALIPTETVDAAVTHGWQLIETAPKDGTPILIYDPRRCPDHWEDTCNISLVHWSHGDWALVEVGSYAEDNGANNDQPTHWMPLPPPPTQEGRK